MTALLESLNHYNGLITAIATIVLACLSYAIKEISEKQAQTTVESAKIAATLRDIELKRDAVADPLVYLFFEGYRGNDASFILQNSGRRSMFLRSLRIEIPNSRVKDIRLSDPRDQRTIAREPDGDELTNIIITTDVPFRVSFRSSSSSGCHFEVLFQLYTGNPVRLPVDPMILAGYAIKAPGSSRLEIEIPTVARGI